MYKAIIIVVSDRCYRKDREDLTGPAVSEILHKSGYTVDSVIIVPDEEEHIISALKSAVSKSYDLILTCGGTGFSKRDITPECTRKVIIREAPGISEYMRYMSMKITPRGMLSRGVSGIVYNSLIVNLPGSPKAAVENLMSVIDSIEHGLKMLNSTVADCASD